MESKDPKMFWGTVKHLINKRAAVANISPQNCVDYFRDLLNIKPQTINTFLDYIKTTLPVIENVTERGSLDYEIVSEELQNSIKKSKTGKSTGPDLSLVTRDAQGWG